MWYCWGEWSYACMFKCKVTPIGEKNTILQKHLQYRVSIVETRMKLNDCWFELYPNITHVRSRMFSRQRWNSICKTFYIHFFQKRKRTPVFLWRVVHRITRAGVSGSWCKRVQHAGAGKTRHFQLLPVRSCAARTRDGSIIDFQLTSFK